MMTARSPACQSLRSGASPRICSSRRVGLFKPVAFISRSPSSSTDEAVSLQRVQAGQRRPLSMPTIKLITATVEIQAQTQRFERLAGRSAMIGVLVALVAELLTEQSIFRHFDTDTVSVLGSVFLAAVSMAAVAAFTSRRKLGMELLEAVVTSLTANQRSAASVTERQVDTAVDNVLNKAFDQGVICSILAGEDYSDI